MLHLAKPRVDLGLHTNDRDAMLAFWQDEIGLPYDHMLKLGGGRQQHRHDLLGSVLKINHVRDPLPTAPRSGYRELLIARAGLGESESLTDPDGNRITLVPPGLHGIERIGVRMGVRDVAAHRRFYAETLGLEAVGDDAFRCGDSVLLVEADPDAAGDVVYQAAGYRYITIQVFDVDAEHAGILARGGTEGRAPATLGTTARISFVRDPDGNWIEISQRASLVGPLTI